MTGAVTNIDVATQRVERETERERNGDGLKVSKEKFEKCWWYGQR